MVLDIMLRTVMFFVFLLAQNAHGAMIYRFEFVPGTGDTTALLGLNNNGDLLFLSGQACSGGCSFIVRTQPYGVGVPEHIIGLPLPWAPSGTDSGTEVNQVNSAGDMIGTTDTYGLSIPTFWRDGVAYDLRDPANAGLIFVPDSGLERGNFDLSALTILDVPSFVTDEDWKNYLPHFFGIRNIGGLYAFEFPFMSQGPTAVLIPVSSPGTASLVALAFAAIFIVPSVRRNRIRKQA